MMFLRLLTIILLAAFSLSLPAQQKSKRKKKATTTAVTKKKGTTKKKVTTKNKPQTIGGLKSEREEVKRKIAAEEKKLADNERNVKQRLQNLMVLNNDISDTKETISGIKKDISKLDANIATFDKQLRKLQAELKDTKDKYVRSLRYMHRNRSEQNQLMFIFSADNFSQMYRRMRLMREYATYQRQQGERVKAKETEVANKRAELRRARRKHANLLAQGEKEQKALEGKQKEQQKMVSRLQSQQKTIQKVILAQQQRADEIDREIDRLVAIEVERARKAAEAEAAAHRKTVQEKKNKGKELSKKEVETERRYSEAGMVTAADYKLNGSFASNRGRLPIPVTGKYRIVERFGNYNVSGLKGVRLNNKGINIKAQPGARVRSVFDGVVSQVFRLPGSSQDGIIVRHGSYMTVYWPVVNTRVKRGQRVSARQQLGTLAGENVLEFQLRKEKALLNPEPWLGK